MRRFCLTFLLCGAAWSNLLAQSTARRPDDGSRQSVLLLLRSGVSSETVRAYIEAHDLRFSLSAADVVALKQAGADDALLTFLLARSARVGEPTAVEDGHVVYEADGVRAFRRRDAKGAEVLVITNLDDNGVRLDSPPSIPDEDVRTTDVEEEEEPAPPPREFQRRRRARAAETRAFEAFEEVPFEEPPPVRSYAPASTYTGPYYPFTPSNVPGPNSPWSPIYSLVPFYDAWRPWPIPTYHVSIVGLPPVLAAPRHRAPRQRCTY